jgi:hypothetical protein
MDLAAHHEVLDHAARDLGLEAVVAAGKIGAGIVQVVGVGLFGRPAGGEIAVAERAQGLAQRLLAGVEGIVEELPVVILSLRGLGIAARR